MDIIVAPGAGFCFGVKNAVSIAENLGAKACVLGELIHNRTVLKKLESKGVVTVSSPDACPEGRTLVIRSHGESRAVFDRIKELGKEYIDATCPFVKKIHELIAKAGKDGKTVIIIGDKGHPEVVGSAGWTEGRCIIVSTEEEALNLDITPDEKCCSVVQTTFDAQLYNKIIKIIENKCKSVEINRTICYTTSQRQKEAEELSRSCDAVLVVGDRHSSNTGKLYKIAASRCPRTYFVENIADLSAVAKNITRLGITAGASTPQELIEEVKQQMSETQENKAIENVAETTPVEPAAQETTAETTEVKAVEETAVQSDAKEAEAPAAKEEAKAAPKKETFAELLEKSEKHSSSGLKEGKLYKGCKVINATADGIYINFGGKKDGFIDKKDAELDGVEYDPANYQPNDSIDAIVISNSGKTNKDAVAFSKKMVDERKKVREEAEKALRGSEFKATVSEVVKGGLIAKMEPYTIFIPASQIRIGYVNDLEKYLGKTLRLRMIQAKKKGENAEGEEGTETDQTEIKITGRRIVASQRVILEEEKARKEEELWAFMEPGKIVQGKVKRFAEFGAFVNVHGYDCLAHISDLSYHKIDKPEEVLEKDKTYDFVILKVDRENGRVSLGYKQLQKKPYEIAAEKFPVGTVITGTVRSVFPYGAFVLIDQDVDGLIPVAEISHSYTKDATQVFKVGDEVTAKIIKFEDNKITLSIKALTPEKVEAEEVEITDEEYQEAKEKRASKNASKFDRSATHAAPKKKKAVREAGEPETGSWKAGDSTNATLGDLFKGLNFDFEDEKKEGKKED